MNTAKRKKPLLTHARKVSALLILYDVLAVNAAYFGALWLRYDLLFDAIKKVHIESFFRFAPYYTVLCILVFLALRLYSSIWRFASFHELLLGLAANFITFVIQCVGITVFLHRMPLTYYFLGGILQTVLTVSVRFAYRFVLLLRSARSKNRDYLPKVMVIGAGSAGQMIVHDLLSQSVSSGHPVCIIDDNPNKWDREIDGVPVVGGREDILSAVEKYRIDKIFLAIPSASVTDKRDILNICSETGCELKQLPSIRQLLSGDVTVNELREVNIEDLLGRDPIVVNNEELFSFLGGRTVLVTGGGGSIGSELCRQIAAHAPRQLIIFDVYENNAYSIQQELKHRYPELELVTLIGSVRDAARLQQLFSTYRPELVFHAAAHKHVPLMEDSPCESVKNNVFGTYKTARMALAYGCRRFVLISTDKAVNPTNIMGASKRLCEMVIQLMDKRVRQGNAAALPLPGLHPVEPLPDSAPQTEFVAVRFGNVLGSNGSVVPLFMQQIRDGGPVTVTHPDIIRYFMTVCEAVNLVLQAGAYAHGGEIFVLDMGEPVRIDTMARNLIRLSGLKPDVDIRITYTGLRPGEKLYEEKLMAEEGLQKTANDKIFVANPLEFADEAFLSDLTELYGIAYANEASQLRDKVEKMVPTYVRNPEELCTI